MIAGNQLMPERSAEPLHVLGTWARSSQAKRTKAQAAEGYRCLSRAHRNDSPVGGGYSDM